jgi:hypothetical protein
MNERVLKLTWVEHRWIRCVILMIMMNLLCSMCLLRCMHKIPLYHLGDTEHSRTDMAFHTRVLGSLGLSALCVVGRLGLWSRHKYTSSYYKNTTQAAGRCWGCPYHLLLLLRVSLPLPAVVIRIAGPFYAFLSHECNYGVIFAFITAIILQAMLTSLLTLATCLEDPFEDSAPDAISVYEARDHVEFVSDWRAHTLLLMLDPWLGLSYFNHAPFISWLVSAAGYVGDSVWVASLFGPVHWWWHST